MDGAWENIKMAPSQAQANENASKKVQLAELPKEMLEEILVYLDDESLLCASHVCKLFASVAEMAFARKYKDKWYTIKSSWRSLNSTMSFQKVMLNKYGEKMRKIEIVVGDEETFDLVEQKCCNATALNSRSSRIILLKNLKEASLGSVRSSDHEIFAEFININSQLESLELRDSDNVLLNMLDGRLNNLKTLKYDSGNSVGLLLPNIRLNSLETLHLRGLKDATDCVRLLQSMNYNKIKKLVLMVEIDLMDLNNVVITEICKLTSLVSLDLPRHRISSDEVMQLATHLPHLTELSVGIVNGGSGVFEILSTTSTLPKLTKLSIQVGIFEFDRLANELKTSAHGFHARFAKSNTEIKVINFVNMISITTDYLLMVQEIESIELLQERSVELHWMDNLNEVNVRKVLSSMHSAKEIKFVNHCADRTFDISALANMGSECRNDFQHTKCLDIKSNGPIIVKSNVSRYQEWFPCLKTLKIHLERHSANDFLRNLQANFCVQIEELWLNTKGDAEDPDMPNALSKFGNLESLHLGPSSIKFDLDHLFSVCQNLTEIKHTRVLCHSNKQ